MATYDRPFGRHYEDFEVGDVYRHWPGKTITEYDDHLFCLLTMNHHPLHLDANYAENTTQFGKNVVVGNYIYSLLLGMSEIGSFTRVRWSSVRTSRPHSKNSDSWSWVPVNTGSTASSGTP